MIPEDDLRPKVFRVLSNSCRDRLKAYKENSANTLGVFSIRPHPTIIPYSLSSSSADTHTLEQEMIIWEAFSDDHNLHLGLLHSLCPTLRSHNTENSKQIFPGKELHGYSPNSYIHVSVSDLYIPLTDLPIQLQEIFGPILGIYKSFTYT